MNYIKSFGPPSDIESKRVSQALLDISDYEGRDGYQPDFLKVGEALPLPGVKAWQDDLVKLKDEVKGDDRSVLNYTHFSVKMRASRKMPFFSACNIDGKLSSRGAERTDIWRRDSRIDNRFQNLSEAYGNEREGLFSRGHMTRREDPNWGDDTTVKRADMDTFHITNVCPQRQGFNAGLWLDLENYVLDNTDKNDFRVSVITGPVFDHADPVYYNVKVPVEFWKVLAFKHAETKQLTTIAYKRSQLTFLPGLKRSRFVLGDFDDTQVTVASIAESTQLDLDAFIAYDVMQGADPSLEVRLQSVSDLFLR